MASYYVISGREYVDFDCAIRGGTLPEMLSYTRSSPGFWRLFKVSRRGVYRELTLVDDDRDVLREAESQLPIVGDIYAWRGT